MRIGIISDIHENIQALRSAIVVLERSNVDRIVCLGDIVGYCVPFYGFCASRDANEVVSIIKSICSVVVAGNHDLFAVRRIPKTPNGFDYPDEWYSLDFLTRKRLAQGRVWLYEDNELASLLTNDNMAYLSSLPEYSVFELDGHNILFSHYPYPDLTGSLTLDRVDSRQLEEHFDFMASANCLHSFSGNDHIPGARVIKTTSARLFAFGFYNLGSGSSWICGPAVTSGTTPNGILIYDSKSYDLEIMPLGSAIHVPPVSY